MTCTTIVFFLLTPLIAKSTVELTLLGILFGFVVLTQVSLKKSHGRLQQKDLEKKFVGESMGFGIWKFDPVSGGLEWDDRMYSLFDQDPKNFSGAYSAWENALSPKAKEEAVKELGLALSGEKEFNTEFEIQLKNGETRYIAGRGVVLRNEKNEATRMIGLNWDVTNRVLKEQELKDAHVCLLQSSKLASLGEMSAGIAHEINNPLAIISGSVGLLSKYKDEPEKFKAKIESIQKSCERITAIVRGLKKFSRSSETTPFVNCSLCEIAKETLQLTESRANKFNTPVTIECSTPAIILCNEIEIEQVLVNLVSNAIDAVDLAG
jgi:uncharacterized protein affecting Mg2+/Co2+ transport